MSGTCDYVVQRGEFAHCKCGSKTINGAKLCWKHKARDVSQIARIDPKTSVTVLERQARLIKRDLKRVRGQAREIYGSARDGDLSDREQKQSLSSLRKMRINNQAN